MAKVIIQDDAAHVLKYTCTGDVTSGELLVIGKVVGIALEAGATGDVIGVCVGCEATVTKKAAAATAITVGGWVTYTATQGVNKIHGTTATGADVIGYGLAAATTGATSGSVKLVGDPIRRAG